MIYFFVRSFHKGFTTFFLIYTFLTSLNAAAFSNETSIVQNVNYDIVYVRQPRDGDNEHIIWPEAFHPGRIEPNSDLMLLHPDNTEEVLVDTEFGAVTDPFVSFDGQWVYYSLFHDVRSENLNPQRKHLPKLGADIFRIHLATRKIEQLTFQEFTPNTGSGKWDVNNPLDPGTSYNSLGYGILNTGPAQIADNKLVFTSNRNGYRPTKSYTYPTMQLFVMDLNGNNVQPISPMTIGSALHPTPLANGHVMFSTYESQGTRDERLWGIWSIRPDGQQWQPIVSAFKHASVFHFMTQLSDKSLVVEDYYNLNNFGFGALYRIPAKEVNNEPAFHSAFTDENPEIKSDNYLGYLRMPFTPKGMHSMTPLSHASDRAANNGAGKYTHPSAAPNNSLLVAWSDGPVNKLGRPTSLPTVDSGIYLIRDGQPVEDISQLIKIKNHPDYNEVWPRAVVTYQDVHGIHEPIKLDWLPNNGNLHDELPQGTPYGLIGTSSFYKRESFPSTGLDSYNGLDPFNSKHNNQSSNWYNQGADAGIYTNTDIWAVRILSMEPIPDVGYGPNSTPQGGKWFYNHANEKLRILGEIPLRKYNSDGSPVLDPEGNPDTSFLAKIPADTPFTFQTIDKNGMVLNFSQTWHQVRPGEVRTDCGGCHAHSSQPLKFSETAASLPNYSLWDLTEQTPLISQHEDKPSVTLKPEPTVNIEFYQNIRPILQEKCTSCHSQALSQPAADLVFDDLTEYNDFPGDYKRLCNDTQAEFGIPPLVTVSDKPQWRQTNASRYVRKFQSRRSLLIWKIFGKRLDGWTNDDHPSAAILGDPESLPDGASIQLADLDYRGDIMPIPNHGIDPLTADQKLNFARWIDLGCPIDLANGISNDDLGWFRDDVKPTLTVTKPKMNRNSLPIEEIIIGLADAYSGLDMNSFKVISSVDIDGIKAGENISYLFSPSSKGVYQYKLASTLPLNLGGELFVSIKDNQGNISFQKHTFLGADAIDYVSFTDIDVNVMPGTVFNIVDIPINPDNLVSYGPEQDKIGEFEVFETTDINSGIPLYELKLVGNVWKQLNHDFLIDKHTVLQFEFKSESIGEIHAIGFDNVTRTRKDKPIYNFQITGTQQWAQEWGNETPYVIGSWQTFTIPVGKYLTGEFNQLTFINDQDAESTMPNSYFRNVKIIKPQRD